MKKTKVYVDELPESCVGCDFAFDGKCQALERKQYYCIENCRRSDCPLRSIKDYKRELVKEVCDEIARNVRVRKIKKEWYAIETDLRAILDQIQKEYEDE